MLLLKRHLVELVRRGEKRQTIRLWTRPLLRAGQISYTPGLGKMKITAIDKLPGLAALTPADAQADGFPTLAALLAEIRKIYGPTPPANRHVYRIRFSWPIDAAGKTLILPHVLLPRASEKTRIDKTRTVQNHSIIAKHKSPPAALPPALPRASKSSASRMTPLQRESLRTFILQRKPRR
jgi:hypothetical protein